MPAQQCLRGNEKTVATLGREQSACRGEEGTVTWSQPWALDLTAQDIELVAQHDQLDVLDPRGPAATDQQPQQGYADEIDEGEEHRTMLPEPAQCRRSRQIRVLAPFSVPDRGFDQALQLKRGRGAAPVLPNHRLCEERSCLRPLSGFLSVRLFNSS